MKLFKKFQSKKKREKYITIILSDRTVTASLWMINGSVQILENSPIIPLSGGDQNLADIDKCLQDLGKASEEVKKVVFCLNESWVENDLLSSVRKPFLQNITKQLFLKPVGFVTIIEALQNSWKKNDEFSSVIAIFLEETVIHLKLIREHKVISEYSVDNSDDLVADLIEGIARLINNLKDETKLPSKIVLISISHLSEEMEEKNQSLISVDWSKHFSFIKDPLIEWLSQEKLLKIVTEESSKVLISQQDEPDNSDKKNIKINENKDINLDDHSSGLVDNNQILNHEIAVDKSLLPNKEYNNQTQSQTSFGVPVKNDYFSKYTQSDVNKNEVFLHKINKKKKKKKSKSSIYMRSILIGFCVGALILIGVLYLYLKSIYQVLIKIKPHSVALSKEIVLTLDSSSETSLENLVLQADIVDQEVSGEKTAEATGKDKIGEKATGEVTIYNKTDKKKEFKKGTIITKDDYEFSLSDDVEIDAATTEESDDGEVKHYGKKIALVDAMQIGEESNLSKGVVLKIDGYSISSYSASAKENFTGGSSEEITVVSEEDHTNLLSQLKEELIEQAKLKFESDSGQGRRLFPTNDSETVTANYDKDIGVKADAFSLNLTLKVKAISYLSKDLIPLSKSILTSELPEGYLLSEKKPSILDSPKEQSDQSLNKIELIINIGSDGIAQIDLNETKSMAKGKEFKEVKSDLMSNEKIDIIFFKVKPSFLSYFFSKIPDSDDRVSIEIISENEN